jgi:hypothetical protein
MPDLTHGRIEAPAHYDPGSIDLAFFIGRDVLRWPVELPRLEDGVLLGQPGLAHDPRYRDPALAGWWVARSIDEEGTADNALLPLFVLGVTGALTCT